MEGLSEDVVETLEFDKSSQSLIPYVPELLTTKGSNRVRFWKDKQ
jgi:hypothetical protein